MQISERIPGLKSIFAPETHLTNGPCREDADFDIACSSYFNLNPTYLACEITTEISVGLPQACMVQFNSTTSSG